MRPGLDVSPSIWYENIHSSSWAQYSFNPPPFRQLLKIKPSLIPGMPRPLPSLNLRLPILSVSRKLLVV
jgi:hypothetical protein